MAGSVNKAILIGHAGKDPEIFTTKDGRKIASFSIATSEHWRDKNTGERMEKTYWHNIKVFNEGLAKVVEQYVRKGSHLYIEGQVQTREYEKDGQKRYVTEIVLQGYNATLTILDSRGDRRVSDDAGQAPAEARGGAAPIGRQDPDDSIPFFCEWR